MDEHQGDQDTLHHQVDQRFAKARATELDLGRHVITRAMAEIRERETAKQQSAFKKWFAILIPAAAAIAAWVVYQSKLPGRGEMRANTGNPAQTITAEDDLDDSDPSLARPSPSPSPSPSLKPGPKKPR